MTNFSIKNRESKKKSDLSRILLLGAGATAVAVTGCSSGGGGGGSSGGGDDDDDDPPVNHAPVFEPIPSTTATENLLYNPTAKANDPDGDAVDYYLSVNPVGMTINPTTGLLSWIPDDSVSDMDHDVTIIATDGKVEVAQSYVLYVINTESIFGTIINAENGGGIPMIEVKVGAHTTNTNDLGTYWINNVPDGDHAVTLTDLSGIHTTHKPGFFRVGKLEAKTADAALYLKEDQGFVNDTMRRHGAGLAKYFAKPKVRIFLREEQSNAVVAGATVTAIKDLFKTEINQAIHNGFTPYTDADLTEIVDTKVTGQPPDGYVFVYWDNSVPSGSNNSWLDGNEVKRSFARFNTGTGKPVHLQELSECFLGSTTVNQVETADPVYSLSTFYATSANNNLSTKDLALFRLAYKLEHQRASGNKDLGTPDNRDVNPATHQWNKAYVAPAAEMKIKPAGFFLPAPKEDDCPEEDYSTPVKPQEVHEVF